MFMQVAILLIHVFSNTLLYARADDEGGQLTAASGHNQVDFDRLRHLLETLDYHLRDFQKRTCRLGLHNHHCAFIDLERLKNAGNFLRSAASPGKRSKEMDVGLPEHQITSDEFRAANAVLEDLMEQRQAIATLSRLLAATRADMSNIRNTKRDCRFRLGGHCLTESLDRVASNYYYLKSPNSPGRRRRHLEGDTRMHHEY